MIALTAQKAFLNNFENVVNWRVDIWEDIKWYRNTLSYPSGTVDCSLGLGVCVLPSDMNLNIKFGFNNKLLVSDSRFSLGKNDMVDTIWSEKTSPIILKHTHKTSIIHAPSQPSRMKRKGSLWYSL